MSVVPDPMWPSQVVAASWGFGLLLFFTWFVLGGARRVPGVRHLIFGRDTGLGPAWAFGGGLVWLVLAAAGFYAAVQVATDSLRASAQEGLDAWWTAGKPEDFPVPPDLGIGAVGWTCLAVAVLVMSWGMLYLFRGYARYGSTARAVRVGLLRLGLVTAVVLACSGVLWWEALRRQQAWAEWIEVLLA